MESFNFIIYASRTRCHPPPRLSAYRTLGGPRKLATTPGYTLSAPRGASLQGGHKRRRYAVYAKALVISRDPLAWIFAKRTASTLPSAGTRARTRQQPLGFKCLYRKAKGSADFERAPSGACSVFLFASNANVRVCSGEQSSHCTLCARCHYSALLIVRLFDSEINEQCTTSSVGRIKLLRPLHVGGADYYYSFLTRRRRRP